MVRIGKGQAILGGKSGGCYQTNEDFHSKIYALTCSNRNCIISLLDRELSVGKEYFVAIPIPDQISGCIKGGKKYFKKKPKRFIQPNIFVLPFKYRLPVPNADWGWFLPRLQQQPTLFF